MEDTNPGPILIKAARLIDGNGGSPIKEGAVLIEGDQITAVGSVTEIEPVGTDRIEVLDYGDRTILPGFVDSHVHLIGIGDGRAGDELTTLPDEVLTLQAARNARTHLHSGVTTVRDCGAKNRTTFMLRQAMEMEITYGPKLVLTGRPAAIIGGHLSYFGIQATGVDECRAAVRQLIKEGADFVKITASGGSTRTSISERPSFNVDELTAICDEVRKFGKHTAAHCVNSQAMLNCLDAGIDTIIHGRHVEPDGSTVYREDVTERIAKQGVFVNYNMGTANYLRQKLGTKRDQEGLTENEQDTLDGVVEHFERDCEIYSRMRSGGVTIVCGSDSAWGPYKMGQFNYEVEAHEAIGITPMEAIVAATKDAARSCMVDDRVGTLEPSKEADILVVDGDPSREITAIREVVDVFKSGCRVSTGASEVID